MCTMMPERREIGQMIRAQEQNSSGYVVSWCRRRRTSKDPIRLANKSPCLCARLLTDNGTSILLHFAGQALQYPTWHDLASHTRVLVSRMYSICDPDVTHLCNLCQSYLSDEYFDRSTLLYTIIQRYCQVPHELPSAARLLMLAPPTRSCDERKTWQSKL